MELEEIRKLYAYNQWANDEVLASIAGLSWEELTGKDGTSFGSLWGTLVHIFGVELLYPQRWRGKSPPALPSQDSIAGVEALRKYWEDVRADQRAFIDGLTEDRLVQRLDYINLQGEKFGYPLVDQMRHLVNHSSYHRGQVSLQLRRFGRTVRPTDYLLYLDNEVP